MPRFLFAFLLLLSVCPAWAAGAGNPAPYFVSLKDTEANMREGPSEANRIKWVYRHQGLPLEVLSVFEGWRRVRDKDGETGWIHMALLSRDRTAVITGVEDAPVYRRDDPSSELLAQAKAGAIGKLVGCGPKFCEVKFAALSGWISRARLWGVHDDEQF